MRTHVKDLDLDQIVSRIRKNAFAKKSLNSAILNATNVNLVVGFPSVSDSRSNEVSSRNRKMRKLSPWFEKIKSKQTVSSKLQKEEDRVKILNIHHEKKIVQ